MSAARAFAMTRRLDEYLSATQLGITLASLGLGWVGEPALTALIEPPLTALGAPLDIVHAVSLVLAFATITILHIVLGELVPKTAAIQRSEQVARATAAALRGFFVLTWPAMWLLNGLSGLVLRMLGLPVVAHAEGKLSLEEIRLVIHASFGDRTEQSRKRDLLERILRGTDRPVRTVMVPRVDMVVLSTERAASGCLDDVRNSGYSRYPLCTGGNPDQVVGYVHVKDLLLAWGGAPSDLLARRRDVLFVPGTAKVGDVLTEFQVTRIPIAIVVDEYGGTDGLVTIEDVVEEMVGEIQDEHDAESPRVVVRDDGSLSVDADVALSEVPGTDLPGGEADVLVGAYVVERLGRLPRAGDAVAAGRHLLTIEAVRRRRIRRVLFTPRTPTEPPPSPSSGVDTDEHDDEDDDRSA